MNSLTIQQIVSESVSKARSRSKNLACYRDFLERLGGLSREPRSRFYF